VSPNSQNLLPQVSLAQIDERRYFFEVPGSGFMDWSCYSIDVIDLEPGKSSWLAGKPKGPVRKTE
jgi:hypothetical protein